MDSRFDTSRDPRFKKVPRNVRKVTIDKRFAHMFTDKSFVETSKVDARGDRVSSNAGSTKLREFYDLADADSASLRKTAAKAKKGKEGKAATEDAEAKPKKKKKLKGRKKKEGKEASSDEEQDQAASEAAEEAKEEASEAGSDAEDESGDENASDASDKGGEGDESSTDIDVSDVESDHDMDASVWDQIKEQEAAPRGDATTRFAVMGCDWDHVSAGDLLVVLRNYLKGQESQKGGGMRTGNVLKVSIYPSEYGLEQMAIEDRSGPQALNAASQEISLEPHGGDEEANEKKQNEALRKYQLQRAKYYFAIATCDSVATASWLYDQLDAMEVDGICQGIMDLRFVPDDMEFPHKPKSESTELPKRYQGPAMLSRANGQTKVKCTWDETPACRKRDLMRKSFTPAELADMDLEEYLASTSGEDDPEPTKDKKGKKKSKEGASALRASLGLGESGDEESDERDLKAEGFDSSDDEESGKEPKMGDMEMTFNVGAEKLEESLAERVDEEGAVKTLKEKEALSPWEAYLLKRKEKRRGNKEKIKADREARKRGEDPAEKETEEAEEVATKEELELLIDHGDGDDRDFNVRGKIRQAAKRAGKEKDGAGFTVDTSDERFSKIFEGEQDFEIDPTHPEYRPSEGMRKVLKAKRDKKKAGTAASTKAPPESAPEKTAPERPAPSQGGGGGGGFGGLQLFAGSKRKAEAPTKSSAKAEASLLDASTTKKKRKKVARGARA